MDDKEPLAALVEPADANQARLIRDPRTTVTQLPTSFLRDALSSNSTGGSVQDRGRNDRLHAARQCGLLSGGECGELRPPDRQRKGHDRHQRAAAILCIDAARGDAKLCPNISCPGAVRRYETAAGRSTGGAGTRARHAYALCPLIMPPHVEADGPGWRVSVFVLSEDNLCLDTVLIARDGTSRVERTVLEAHTLMLPN